MTNVVDNRLHLGSVVWVLKGREAGSLAIVIQIEEPCYVWLADGVLRKAECPKKKNVKHVQPIKYIAQEIEASLQAGETVTNAQLRYALNQYKLLQ